MITERHLAIVRGALQYFDEEMSPHGDAFRTYLNEGAESAIVNTREIAETRALFHSLSSRIVIYDKRNGTLIVTRSDANGDLASLLKQDKNLTLATLLIPSEL